MSFSLTLPLDEGFLRRECPNCERQFKWHHGPTDERPEGAVEPEVYWCPYCGETAPPDHWWTAEQLEFAGESIAGPVMRDLADEFNRSMGQQQRNSIIKVSMTHDEPEPPSAIHEPPDMIAIQSPCHAWEPIKIAEDWTEPVHCLVCGSRFAIG